MKAIFTLFLVSIIFTSVQSQNVDLSLKLEKGKEYKQTSSMKTGIYQDVMGQKVNIDMTVNGTMTFLVKDINENVYDMEAKYGKLSIFMEMMPQYKMEMTSDNSPLLKAMRDITLDVVMSKKGKVLEIKNIDELLENAIQKADQLLDEQREQMKTQITKAFGDEALKNNIQTVTAIFPDEPVKKGDKWTKQTTVESDMPISFSTDYELIEATSDYALIKGFATVDTPNKDTYTETNGMQMKLDLSGTIQSDIKIDVKTGWIIEALIKQEMKGEATFKDSPQFPNGLKSQMTMITENVITN